MHNVHCEQKPCSFLVFIIALCSNRGTRSVRNFVVNNVICRNHPGAVTASLMPRNTPILHVTHLGAVTASRILH